MAGHWTDLYSFVNGAIRADDLGYLILSNDEVAEGKIPACEIVQWEPEGWGFGGQKPWRSAGVAVVRSPLEQLCVVGEFGEVFLVGSGDEHDELIDGPAGSPATVGPLRGVRWIGEHVYAVGVGPQVYRREGERRWTDLSPKRPTSKEGQDAEMRGFEAIDGFAEADMYAVGWEGEIQHFDGRAWIACPSPVNIVLVDVCCAEDGMVYACGRLGTLLRGRSDVWDVVDVGGLSDDIWSLATFGGQVYVSTMDNVFVLENDGLHLVDWGIDRPATCYRLVVGAGMLWSIGAKDVMAYDGRAWTRID